MKFMFLGTAAAEGIPAHFCECEVCRQARIKKGKNIRKRSSYLIDNDILIDPGPDFYWQGEMYGFDSLSLKKLVVTHAHADHLDVNELRYRRTPKYSRITQWIDFYGGAGVLARITDPVNLETRGLSFDELKMHPHLLEDGIAERDETTGFSILPVSADHPPEKTAFVYLLERGGVRVLICNDTGWLSDHSWELLKDCHADLAVLDSTCGKTNLDRMERHMGINTVKRFAEHLHEIHAIKDHAKLFASHFSHNGGCLHEEYEELYADSEVEPAYDGLTLTLE